MTNTAGRSLLEEIAANVIVGRRLHIEPASSGLSALNLAIPLDPSSAKASTSAYLYAHYYAGDPTLCERDSVDYLSRVGLRVSAPSFLEALVEANPGTGYFASGWKVIGQGAEGIRVERGGVALLADVERHLPPQQQDARVGDVVDVRFPKGSVLGSPGFYVAFADSGPVVQGDLARVYLNLHARHAVHVTKELLRRLAAHGMQYTYKVAADPIAYRRRDTAVLYVSRPDVHAAVAAAASVRASCPAAFGSPVPGFTLRVVDGIAVADDPGNSLAERRSEFSFGEHRTSLIAEAICAFAAESDAHTRYPLRSRIDQHLRSAGLDPSRLYLSSADAPDYALVLSR